ncbi:MAG: zinc-finger domain-containing protein [Magnetococcales bacterium]|nr:zinc-finger domain-containing protein [Magnetococcales bacterium]
MPNGRPAEVFFVDTRRFACDGPNFSKHPRVWLTIADGDDQPFCPYCSRLFKID